MIYYVEDDTNLRELTIYALTQAGLAAQGCANDAEFRAACADVVPEAVLLDIMLPDTNGMEILSRIRSSAELAEVPVLMLTAKDTELDTVRALDAGADDYMAKPFGMMEMVSRVRALLRRTHRSAPTQTEHLKVDVLELWPSRRTARVASEPLELTMREFDLLEFLMRDPGEVFSRDVLLRRVWGWDFDGGSRTVDVHVQTLRAKLGPHADLIQTVRGVGYRLRG
jgi:two-component system alkaline phosphatase synthesis response regulator PhoP